MPRNRLTRQVLQDAPHRASSRLHAARRHASSEVEAFERQVRAARLSSAAQRDLMNAARKCRTLLHAHLVDQPEQAMKHATKQIRHLEDAVAALTLAARTTSRHPLTAKHLHQIEQAVDEVLWHVRASQWDGGLCRAVAGLRKTVGDVPNAS